MSEPSQFEKGRAIVTKLFGAAGGRTALSEDFRKITVEHLFGNIWSRPGLELQERSMITLTALLVLGREAELRIHLRGARNLGIPRAKIEELLIHLAHYGGWPVAATGFRVLDEVFAAMDAEAKEGAPVTKA
jgi:4-carboxymuconolactone decarboxylase